jgi:predicted Fe-Mo cluster-binding NifX family protein
LACCRLSPTGPFFEQIGLALVGHFFRYTANTNEEKTVLAIPVFRARVAPVLDWCSKILIFPEEGADFKSHRQIVVVEKNIVRLMQTLREQGIETLICGALSPETLNYGESIGLRIIHGIAGEIEEILQAYREKKLDQPKYRLPGCRRHHWLKGGSSSDDRFK